jgi:hypothetical protein
MPFLQVHVRREVWILGALALVILALRVQTWAEPAERDLDIYAAIGHELLAGRTLYDDLFDQKPPGAYLTYAAGEWLFGYGASQRLALGLLSAWLTLWGLFRVLRAATARTKPALWAAAAFTVINCDLAVAANQPNTEAFINAALVWALADLVTLGTPGRATGRVLRIGLLLFVASFYKHSLGLVALSLGVAHLFTPCAGVDLRRRLGQTLGMAAAAGVPWLCTFGYFAATGRGSDFADTMFAFSVRYGRLDEGLLPLAARAVQLPTHLLWPVAVALLCAAVALVRGQPRLGALTLAYAAGVALTISAMGTHPHYYQHWLPVIALGAGLLAALVEDVSLRSLRAAPALVVALMAAQQLPSRLLTPDDWSRAKYGDTFVRVRDLARQVDGWLLPDETLFEWGAEPGFNVITRRESIVGCVNVWFTLPQYGFGLADRLSARSLAQLQRRPPDLLLLEQGTMSMTSPRHPIARWLVANYTVLSRVGPGPWLGRGFGDRRQLVGYLIAARKGSALLERLTRSQALADHPTAAYPAAH